MKFFASTLFHLQIWINLTSQSLKGNVFMHKLNLSICNFLFFEKLILVWTFLWKCSIMLFNVPPSVWAAGVSDKSSAISHTCNAHVDGFVNLFQSKNKYQRNKRQWPKGPLQGKWTNRICRNLLSIEFGTNRNLGSVFTSIHSRKQTSLPTFDAGLNTMRCWNDVFLGMAT